MVGAGPAGLTLANVLARADVPVTVIDREPGPVAESRAAIVHTRTLELWDRWGLAEPAVEAGARVERVAMRFAGRELASFPLTGVDPSPFPFALALPQAETERLLVERLPLQVDWNTALVGLEVLGEGVAAVVRRADGSLLEIRADYLVGADGAHSLVRRASGIRSTTSGRAPTGFLADVRLSPAPPRGVLELNLARGGFVGALDLGNGRFRLFGALRPEHARSFGTDLQRLFTDHFRIPVRLSDAEWTSTYRIRHQLAEKFRSGPVFLVGDAAHTHAPAGGQGMNLGVGDAVNLGWKLALVARGLATESLLDTYEAERLRVAHAVSRGADRGFALETTANPLLDGARRVLLPPLIRIAAHLPPARRAVHRLFSQTWISYRTGRQSFPGPGDRVPECRIGGRSLYELIAEPVHHLLLSGAAPHDPTGAYRLPIRSHRIEPAELHRLFGADAVLVRPDGHIAATARADDLTNHLDTWYR
ncbi:FAD-dependent monooxygenase [Saccharopolyspora taberi]|uniref:FAD-dependent monooxygenase n=1 Tax=Saccharopolyspora taberi TaxID=60895 RepID=A0ABN3VI92_9PSEU